MLMGVLLLSSGTATLAQQREFDQVQAVQDDSTVPPANDGRWAFRSLPDSGGAVVDRPHRATWYRTRFDGPAPTARNSWAVYLPYLYNGGQVWLNGSFVADVPESNAGHHNRWDRPHLIPLPASQLLETGNVLAIRAAVAPDDSPRRFPRIRIGAQSLLHPMYERRLFWTRTLPQITVSVCLLSAVFVLFIWWRRRSEVLYGLFGLAAFLWGIRTLTFVVEQVPTERWTLWRAVYLGATGGFIVVMAMFAMRHAGLRKRWTERAMVAYCIIGPLWLLLTGAATEPLVNRVWTAGLIPIGLSILILSVWRVSRERTLAATFMPVALVLAVLAGIHDYMIAWDAGQLVRVWPAWAAQRIFLLHYAANLLLLTMGGLLAVRFTRTLDALEDLNQNLESKVADRERELASNFARMATLQQENASSQARQLVMREIHDGLGSRLFTLLSRVERGDTQDAQVAEALRGCIGEMRLALDALAPGDLDFRAAWGNFLFRWQSLLEDAGVRPEWTIDMPEDATELAPKTALQLLRIAQEALTNVLKHAQATGVRVSLRIGNGRLELVVSDNGRGAATPAGPAGRGIDNMQARARQIDGHLEVRSGPDGMRVALRAPVPSHVDPAVKSPLSVP